ncbi:MAG: PQQ-dependent sugar dehydrogenase [Thermoanaerobaculia bacterium]
MRWRTLRWLVAAVLLALAGLAWRDVLARMWTAAEVAAATAAGTSVPDGARGRGAATGGAPPSAIALLPVVSGLAHPLFLTHAGDGSGRLFIVEQGGTIRVVENGRLRPVPFLDAAAMLDESDGERGLLGLAFPPDYRSSGRFYIAHTAPGPTVRITSLRVAADPNRADPASAATVLSMDDPAGNHNGGMIAFGPDGNLWTGTGDGGSAGDPWDHARDRGSLLGKILRLDVRTAPYAIPPDNPFARGGGRGEIWALGLRNPWRFSFDRQTGELWTGDVGQNAWEEIDVEDPRSGGGRHYGWKTMEGLHCFSPRNGCDPAGLHLPIHEYGHDQGCSVTGGYAYRGRAIPRLVGAYLFSDYCSGRIWALTRDAAGRATVALLLESHLAVSSFGEDEAGELYVCDHRGGVVYRIQPGGAGS